MARDHAASDRTGHHTRHRTRHREGPHRPLLRRRDHVATRMAAILERSWLPSAIIHAPAATRYAGAAVQTAAGMRADTPTRRTLSGAPARRTCRRLSLCVFLYVSVSLRVCLSARLSACLSRAGRVCHSACLSLCVSVSLCVCLLLLETDTCCSTHLLHARAAAEPEVVQPAAPRRRRTHETATGSRLG
jgi:hypothetical protein